MFPSRILRTLIVCSLFLSGKAVAQAAKPSEWLFVGTVVTHAADQSTVELTRPDGTGRVTWPVIQQPEVRAQVAAVDAGDRVEGSVIIDAGHMQIIRIQPVAVQITRGWRVLAMVGAFVVLLLLAQLVPGGARWLVVGEDNRYSNSKTQMALWFITLMASYLATVVLRSVNGGAGFFGGVNVPENLLWLSGISALTFAGAKTIVASRLDTSPALARKNKPNSPFGPRLRDLVTDDSGVRADFGDFQMLVITLIAIIVYALTIYGWLGQLTLHANTRLPDVDSTLLGTFGVGQGAYLAKKLAGDTGKTSAPGPVMTDSPPRPVSVTVPPLQG